MRIKLEQLTQTLKNQSTSLYTFSGNEPLLIQEATDQVRIFAREHGYTERELFTIDQHFNWSDLLSACNNRSLFGDRKFIDIRIPSGKPGKEGSKAIEAYCKALPPDAITLVTLPRIDKQGQASKWFKTLESTGVFVPLYPIDRDQLPEWLSQRLARQHQKTTPATLQFLADRLEGNLLAAHQEMQKLALLYPNGELSFDQVKDVVLNVARYDVYQLADALISGDSIRYHRILSGLQEEGTAPLLILATLTEQIRQLITIRKGLNSGQSPDQLLLKARIWGERQKIFLTAAKRTSSHALLRKLCRAAQIDRIIKGVVQGDVWDELLQLGLPFIDHSGLMVESGQYPKE